MTPVLFEFISPNGDPIANAPFEVQLSRSDANEEATGVVLPRVIPGMTDADGKCTLNLVVTDSMYHVTMYDPVSDANLHHHFYVPEMVPAGTPVHLQDIIVAKPISPKIYDEEAILVINTTKANVLAARDQVQTWTGQNHADSLAAQAAATAANTSAVLASAASTAAANSAVSAANAAAVSVRFDSATQGLTGTQKTNALTNLGIEQINNTSDANKPVSTAQQAALNLKANIASLAAVATSGLKADVGLGNVNNTSDANKPVSTAQQTALNLKADITYVDGRFTTLLNAAPAALDTLNELAAALGNDANFATTTSTALGYRLRVDVANQGLTAGQKMNALTNLGIDQLNNTSDLNKPVSTAMQTALNLKADISSISNINNTSDVNKPVSTAQQTALNLKANLASPVFSGGVATVSGGITTVLSADSSGGYVEAQGANNLRFYTNGGERLRATGGGNILIGTTTDDGVNRLQVNGPIKSIGNITALDASYLTSSTSSNTSARNWAFGQIAQYGRFDISASNAQYGDAISAGTSILSLMSSGRVLVGGIDNGTDKLQVNGSMSTVGSIKLTSSGSAYIETAGGNLSPGLTSMLYGQDNTGLGYLWNRGNYGIAIGTNSQDRMRITAGGNVLVGTTTDNGSDKLQVAGTAYVASQVTVGNGTTGTNNAVLLLNSGSSANTGALIIGRRNGVMQFGIGSKSVAEGGTSDNLVLDAIGNGIEFYTGSNYRAQFAPSGALLVGTSSDNNTDKLQVNGTIQARASSSGVVYNTITNSGTTGTTANAGLAMQVYDGSGVNSIGYVFSTANSWAYAGYLPLSTVLVGYSTGGTNIAAAHASGMVRFFAGGENAGNERFRMNGSASYAFGTLALWPSASGGAGSYSISHGSNNSLSFNNDYAGVEVMRFTGANVLIGTSTDDGVNKLQVNGSISLGTNLRANSGTKSANFGCDSTGPYIEAVGATDMRHYSGGAERMRLDSSGNLLVNWTSATNHTIQKAGGEGTQILNIGAGGTTSAVFSGGSSAGWSTAGAVLYVGKNTSGRSINAGGTIANSGADYAEYMVKAANCGVVAKGQVVGITVDGQITDLWADAVSFMIKTTNPSLVGGDNWSNHLVRPENTDSPTYAEDMAQFEADLEAARQKVDRIAFAGQVPVNVYGAAPGQFIVPMQSDAGIIGVAIDEDAMTLKQYLKAVGIVQNILADGRANVRVKVA